MLPFQDMMTRAFSSRIVVGMHLMTYHDEYKMPNDLLYRPFDNVGVALNELLY